MAAIKRDSDAYVALSDAMHKTVLDGDFAAVLSHYSAVGLSVTRALWDTLWASGSHGTRAVKVAYDAGFHDAHIGTALRAIAGLDGK
jgi:hypothetical protein